MNDHPIGIFDSGIGGTSIWKEINSLLPNESTIYLADSKNAPYGEKSKDEIIQLCIKNTELLLAKGCKLVVVACNTATTNAIDYLRKHYTVPFIGIEPAIKPAALQSKSKKVGILATQGTLSSSLFHSTTENHAAGIHIFEQVGTGLVTLIESNKINAPETKALLEKYLNPMVAAGIDHLVLGCTHYPYLLPVIKDMLPAHINIIDSGEAVARQTKAVLAKNDLLCNAGKKTTFQFISNANVNILESFLQGYGPSLKLSCLDF